MVGASDKDKKVFKRLKERDPECRECFDCGTADPQWAAVRHAVLVCSDCAGAHRGLGVHISFVRSCTMDAWGEWKPEALRRMRKGGNARCRRYFEAAGVPSAAPVPIRYMHPAAQRYGAYLDADMEGREFDPSSFTPYVEEREAAAPSYSVGEFVTVSGSGLGVGTITAINDSIPPSYIVRYPDGTCRGVKESVLARSAAPPAQPPSSFGEVAEIPTERIADGVAQAASTLSKIVGVVLGRRSTPPSPADAGGYQNVGGLFGVKPQTTPPSPTGSGYEDVGGNRETEAEYTLPLDRQLGITYRQERGGEVVVQAVVAGSAAEVAGVQVGAVLLRVGGAAVRRGADVPAAVAAARRSGAEAVQVVTTTVQTPDSATVPDAEENTESDATEPSWADTATATMSAAPLPGETHVRWRYTPLLADTADEVPAVARGEVVSGELDAGWMRCRNGLYLPAAELSETDRAPPLCLRLRCGGRWGHLSGRYWRLSGLRRGEAWWRRGDDDGWVVSGPRGSWLVAESEQHLAEGLGWVSSDGAHRGAPPHLITAWKVYNVDAKCWEKDDAVSVRSARHHRRRKRSGRRRKERKDPLDDMLLQPGDKDVVGAPSSAPDDLLDSLFGDAPQTGGGNRRLQLL